MTGVIKNKSIIKFKDVTIASVTIPSSGELNISQHMPTGMNNFIFAIMMTFSNMSPNRTAFNVFGTGNWLTGVPNTTITNLSIRYFYTD